MFERFTDTARRIVVLSQEEARLRDHNYIGTEHVLLGMTMQDEGRGSSTIAGKALRELGLTHDNVGTVVTELVPNGSVPPSGHIPFTRQAKKALELALREALQLGHNYIGSEHVLLGIVRGATQENDPVAFAIFAENGITLVNVRDKVIDLLKGEAGVSVQEAAQKEREEREARKEAIRGLRSSLKDEEIEKVVVELDMETVDALMLALMKAKRKSS